LIKEKTKGALVILWKYKGTQQREHQSLWAVQPDKASEKRNYQGAELFSAERSQKAGEDMVLLMYTFQGWC
jgi:hypothetical protein